ncbi:UNVERIFIED_CONTAM: hypothetical protein Sradi_5498100 [Sesamum radiatum]|uniref:Uncharacterized protein n=1 Tax=Sesamum radiatum TaxID=300843 RepID=A0AAW2LAR2_SESRA
MDIHSPKKGDYHLGDDKSIRRGWRRVGNGTKRATVANDDQDKKVAETVHGNEEKSRTTLDLPGEQKEEQPLIKHKTKRVATLDAFRGLTIVRIPEVKSAIRKIILRTLKLLFWGILLQGGYSHAPYNLSYGVNMKHIRWIGGFVAFVIYMVTTFSLFVPDWSFVLNEDDKAERYTACTFSSPGSGPFRADAPSWCHAPFEPEGLLRFLLLHSATIDPVQNSNVVSIFLQLDFSHRYWHYWYSLWTCTDSLQAIPINKQLYSFSYVCFTAGAAAIVFCGLYILIDVWGLRTPFLFLEWIGMNAMLVFVMAVQGIFAAFVNGWYFENPDNNLLLQDVLYIFIV